eukprot:GHVQ01037259.1.p1 GENE.GHVQ01037259.1~~GHVQ01037259.1.p1  ORF type:complete len:456 (+),score=99.95 GHVQ01037259.1:60-1427(+)
MPPTHPSPTCPSSSPVKATSRSMSDSAYFNSYSDIRVHSLLLQDTQRTSAYHAAIELQQDMLKDKVVIDVGAGTGILSLFCARAGAARVIAVEGSKETAEVMKKVVKDNGFSHIIDVFDGRIEDMTDEFVSGIHVRTTTAGDGEECVPDEIIMEEGREEMKSVENRNGDGREAVFNYGKRKLKDNKVDVIISEWMGFYLLHESMLQSVIYARDRWLKPRDEGGMMFPERADLVLSIADCEDVWRRSWGWAEQRLHGFDFSVVGDKLKKCHQHSPIIDLLPQDECERVCEKAKIVLSLDMYTTGIAELDSIHRTVKLRSECESVVRCFVLWFDVFFPTKNPHILSMDKRPKTITTLSSSASTNPSTSHLTYSTTNTDTLLSQFLLPDGRFCLSTGPHRFSTHWKQCLLMFPDPLVTVPGLCLTLQLDLTREPPPNNRRYALSVSVVDAQIDEGMIE